jgi:hypothetical protein
MSDDRRTSAVGLPGDPEGWTSTLRDVLGDLEGDPADRQAVARRLGSASTTADGEEEGTGGADAADGAERIAFLEDLGILEATDDGVVPGPYGSEFLESGEEAVLYEALTDAVGGFETLLSSLVVRPLTDVEFGDLLEREFDTDLAAPDAIVAHRQWLVALGYVDHDDGVNELTRAGRRRVATDDDLEPPGTKAARRDAGNGEQADQRPGSGDAEPGAVQASDENGPTDENGPPAETATADENGPTDETATAGATKTADSDDPFSALKQRYDHTCMVCGERRWRAPDEGYAVVHHPMPTGEDHGGPAEAENAVVVCPNHRADFAFGLLTVDPRTHEIEHAYEEAVSGRTLATVDGHDVGPQYLAYHAEVVAQF